jgi:hypothetical protein
MAIGTIDEAPMYEDEESKANMLSHRPKSKGRPKYNIFVDRAKKLGKEIPPFESAIVHIRVKIEQKRWLTRYVGARKEALELRSTNKRFAWSIVISAWGEGYLPFRHAERAMILCGRYTPEIRFNIKSERTYKPSWYDQFFWFRHFCDEVKDRTSSHLRLWNKRGQKPDPEKIYRTAVSTLVARKYLNPNGGNRYFLPNEYAIAQVWEVIFGEKETPDSIRKRMPTVAWHCVQFGKFGRLRSEARHNAFSMLGESLVRKYPNIFN